jgi:hypothetical protein
MKRRTFLKTAGTAGFIGSTASNLLLGAAKDSPNEKLNIGIIGSGAAFNASRNNPPTSGDSRNFADALSTNLCDSIATSLASFAPGTVLTVEPGIYIPDEGFGIRLEDDIVVTENGPVNLMAKVPVEVDEVESIMNR